VTAPYIPPILPLRPTERGRYRSPFDQDPEDDDPIARIRRIGEVAQPDAVARPNYQQPPKPKPPAWPTIGPQPSDARRRPQTVPDLRSEDLELNNRRLGQPGYGLEDAVRDALTGRKGSAFGPETRAGRLLDLTQIPGAARMGALAREQVEEGHPAAAGVTASLAALPFMGRVKKLAKGADDMLPRGAEPLGTAFKAPIDEGVNPRLANLKRLNLEPEAEQKVRDAYTRLDLDKRTVTWDETRAAAAELGIAPGRLLDKAGRLRGDELLAVRDAVSQNAKRMVELGKERAAAKTDDARRLLDEQLGRLSEETDQFLKRYSTERTRAGRDLNALKIMARESMDPDVWLAQGQRVKRDLPLTAEEATQITAFTQKNDRDGLIRYVSSLHKSTPIEKTLAVWKAGLLTNPLTHTVNVTGNVTMAAMETAKEVPAAAIDAVISLVRGTERTKAISPRGLFLEQMRGVSAGVKAAKRTLQHGNSPEELAKWDFRTVQFGDGPAGRIAQAYTDGVFRSLGAEDALFRSAAMGRALEEYMRLEAKRMVKAGTAATTDDAMKLLRQHPPPNVVADAILDAEVATFQQENAIANAISAARRGLRSKGADVTAGLTEVVAPFVKTPTNIAGSLVQYSPLGFVTALTKQIKHPAQKKLAEDLGRAMTGSGLVALGFMLAAEGQATGAAPKDAAERAQWELEGKQPNSLRFGDQWLNVSRLAPAGALLSVGAQMYHAKENAKSTTGGVAAATLTPARVALDQTFLKGVSGALEAVNDPARFGETFLENTAGSLVPAVVAAAARGVDPYQRVTDGPLERIQSRIPGLSQNLLPRRTAFGKPVPSRGGVAAQMLDVTQGVPANKDPLVAELARLGVTVGFPARTVREQGETRRRSSAEYDRFLAQVGPETERALRELLANPLYQRATDEEKEDVVARVVSGSRRVGRAREQQAARPAARGR
jgi:hypothetical protein